MASAIGLFGVLVVVHEPIRRRSARARRAADFYARGLARVEGRWPGSGVDGLTYLDLEHPYAADLDLFGRGSLFERLCTARTRTGEEVLASWLLNPADAVTIAERHLAVDELRPRLDLREDLELLGAEVRAGIDPDALAAWCAAPRTCDGWVLPLAAAVLALAGSAALLGWLFFGTDLRPLLIVAVLDLAFSLAISRRLRTVLADVDQRAHDLVLLSELLTRLEREPFESPLLKSLRAAMEAEGTPASSRIRRLARLLNLLDARRNQFFAPFAALWQWTTFFTILIDAWRRRRRSRGGPMDPGGRRVRGPVRPRCLRRREPARPVPGDLPWPDAICRGVARPSANPRAELRPQRPGARVDDPGPYRQRIEHVGQEHAAADHGHQRGAGVRRAPVRATCLRLSPLTIGATLRIQDSLQAGRSRFYAEITRVRQIVEMARGPVPLLFLFDELFHGTNSHDRTVGAEAVIRGLIDCGAIGLVTTHDLSLARIADALAPRAVNVHFEDQLIDGQMHFDYRMRPGVVQHSNALALMRAIGLDV